MSASKIEWTEQTWNPIVGCSLESPGCTNCYAIKLAGRLALMGTAAHYEGTTQKTKAGFVWTGKINVAPDSILLAPLKRRKPTTYFVNSMSDLFHPDVPDDVIDRVFAVMALCPQHKFQVLTKRSARMRTYLTGPHCFRIADRILEIDRTSAASLRAIAAINSMYPLPNVWLGVSVEDQVRANERIPDLLNTPAAVRFLSCEPLLGPVDLTRVFIGEGGLDCAADAPSEWKSIKTLRFIVNSLIGAPSINWGKIDWVIVGGESGPGARPMHPDWARSIRDQCAAAGVPFHFKQWGEWAPGECIGEPLTRTETGAHFFNGAWSFEDFSPRIAAELHIDDEPVLWQCGKKRAGRLLDGVQHDGMPA